MYREVVSCALYRPVARRRWSMSRGGHRARKGNVDDVGRRLEVVRRARTRRLALVPPPHASHADGAWGRDGTRLWPAWQSLRDWEEHIDRAFSVRLGEELLVLWMISRLACGGENTLLRELIGADLRPRHADPIAEDIAVTAFALGAAWAASAHGDRDLRDAASSRPVWPIAVHDLVRDTRLRRTAD